MMPLPRTPRAFIFDLDGVIIDSEPLHEKAMRAACAQYDISVPDRVFDEYRGQTDRVISTHLTRQASTSVDPEALLAAKNDAYDELFDELTPIPGSVDLIHALDERAIPLALVTSATRRDQQRTFEQFGLDSYFQVIVTADDVEQTKPHPEPYQRAVQQLNLPTSACLVLEDSTRGVKSARRAGCMVVGLCSSFSADALQEAGAHHTVEQHCELTKRLSKTSRKGNRSTVFWKDPVMSPDQRR